MGGRSPEFTMGGQSQGWMSRLNRGPLGPRGGGGDEGGLALVPGLRECWL